MQTSTTELPASRKTQLERETLAMLEGKEEKYKPQRSTRQFLQQGTIPSEADGAESIDWDAPPPYEQSFGNGQRNVSTTVEGMCAAHPKEG